MFLQCILIYMYMSHVVVFIKDLPQLYTVLHIVPELDKPLGALGALAR